MSLRVLPASFLLAMCVILASSALAEEPTTAAASSLAPLEPLTTYESTDRLLSPERHALRQLQEEGRQRIRDLVQRCRLLEPGQERLDLESQIVQLKREYEQRFLAARGRLDLDAEQPLVPEATTAWVANGIVVCNQTGAQHTPNAAADGTGGAYVTWVDERNDKQIYLQRLTPEGDVYPGWPSQGLAITPTPPDWQDEPVVASDGAGGALVTWQQRDPSFGDWDIYVQRIGGSATVAPGWPAQGVPVGYFAQDQIYPNVISDGAGGAIVAWWDSRNAGMTSLYAGRVSDIGLLEWTVVGEWVANEVQALIYPPPICTDGAEGMFVAFQSLAAGNNGDVFVQRLDSSGQVPVGWPSGGENFAPTSYDQSLPDMISDGAGGAVLAWQDYRSNSDYDIYAMRITGDSQRYLGWPTYGVAVSAMSGSDQLEPRLAPDGDGGALVTWSDHRHPTNYIFCTKLTGDGDVVWAPLNHGMRLCLETSTQQGHQVCSDGEGGLIAVWEDLRGADLDLYAQHVTTDGRYAYSLDEGAVICTATGYTWRASVVNVAPMGAIVAFEDNRTAGTTGIDVYAQYITGLINLTPTTTASGWHSPLVPRNSGDATLTNCPLPATLNGNTSTTNLNWISHQKGPYDAPGYDEHVLIDQYPHGWGVDIVDGLNPGAYGQINVSPNTVTGGRHTLHHIMDALEEVPESDESDNVYSEQYVWSPLLLSKETPVERETPPVRGDFELPNCDGFQVNRPPGAAWVVGAAPLHEADDYDLWLFDDYVGSSSGFSNFMGASVQGGNGTDFMVGHFDNTPTTLYPGLVRYDAGAWMPCVVDETDAALRQGSYSGIYADQLMTYGRIVDVYELALSGLQTYYFALHRQAGDSDIAFEIFPSTSGAIYARGSHPEGASMPLNAVLDTLTYTTGASGYHPLVVYRISGSGATESEVQYTLQWGPNPVVDVPEGATPNYDLSFQGVTPNPMVAAGRVDFTLAERGEVRLAVFDLRGRRVGTLLDEIREPGPHSINWNGRASDGRRLGAGIYWLRLDTAGQVITQRAVLLN